MLEIMMYNNFLFLVKDDSVIQPSLLETHMGDHGLFICSAAGHHRWFKDGSELPDDVVPIPTRKQLSIPSTQIKHSGRYSCYGKYENSEKHFIATSELDIICKYSCNFSLS